MFSLKCLSLINNGLQVTFLRSPQRNILIQLLKKHVKSIFSSWRLCVVSCMKIAWKVKNWIAYLLLMKLGNTYLIAIEKDRFTTVKWRKDLSCWLTDKTRKVLLMVLWSLIGSLRMKNLKIRKIDKNSKLTQISNNNIL